MSSAVEPVRLAFCVTDLDPGGAERALVQLVMRLDRRRWQPRVFCLSGPGALVDGLERADVPVVCLGARSVRNVSVVPRLAGELRRVKPALLQTWLYHANLAGRIAGRLAGVRRIVSGIRVAERRGRWRLWLDRATERLVDRHVCVSRDVAEFSVREGGLSRRKIVVIPNGVEFERFAHARPADLTQFGIPSGSRTVLFVGRLDPQKDPRVLLEAAAEMVDELGDVHYLLVGDGPLRDELQTGIRGRGLESRVQLAGWRGDVPELMRAADCLVLSSLWEGMPNVVLEAMAAGLPVVATRVEGVADLVRDGETGVLVSAGSVGELAEGMRRLLSDADMRRKTAFNAQNLVSKEFTWDAVASRHEELYLELLET